MERRDFVKSIAAGATASAVFQADPKKSEAKVPNNSIAGKNISIRYFEPIGETLPSVHVKDIDTDKTIKDIDLWSDKIRDLGPEINTIVKELAKEKPASVKFLNDEELAQTPKGVNDYDRAGQRILQLAVHREFAQENLAEVRREGHRAMLKKATD